MKGRIQCIQELCPGHLALDVKTSENFFIDSIHAFGVSDGPANKCMLVPLNVLMCSRMEHELH
jgi:hypothetical protein